MKIDVATVLICRFPYVFIGRAGIHDPSIDVSDRGRHAVAGIRRGTEEVLVVQILRCGERYNSQSL